MKGEQVAARVWKVVWPPLGRGMAEADGGKVYPLLLQQALPSVGVISTGHMMRMSTAYPVFTGETGRRLMSPLKRRTDRYGEVNVDQKRLFDLEKDWPAPRFSW